MGQGWLSGQYAASPRTEEQHDDEARSPPFRAPAPGADPLWSAAQLHHEWVALLNAYPQTGERALPAKHLETAWEALDAARKELEHLVYQEHPAVAEVYDYFPYEEHRAEVRVPMKPGSSRGRVPFGE